MLFIKKNQKIKNEIANFKKKEYTIIVDEVEKMTALQDHQCALAFIVLEVSV